MKLQPIVIEETVFRNIKQQTDTNTQQIFDEINIESDLTEVQDKQVRDLILKHIGVFSKNEKLLDTTIR